MNLFIPFCLQLFDVNYFLFLLSTIIFINKIPIDIQFYYKMVDVDMKSYCDCDLCRFEELGAFSSGSSSDQARPVSQTSLVVPDCLANWFQPLRNSDFGPRNTCGWAWSCLLGVHLPPLHVRPTPKLLVLYCDGIKSPTGDMYILAIYILFNDHESCQADDLVLKSCYYHPSGRSQPHCSSAAPAPLSPSSSPRCRSQAACPSGAAGAAGAQRPPGTDFPHSAIILPFREGSMELIQGWGLNNESINCPFKFLIEPIY